METPEQTHSDDRFIYIGRDGGTGKNLHGDYRAAYASVPKGIKRRAFTMLGAAGVTLAFLLLTRLLWLFEPLLDKIYYGTLSEVVYYIILGILCTAFIVALNEFIKHKCEVRLFRAKKRPVRLTRALSVIAVCAVAVFIVSAVFGFNLKMQKEMGMGVTLATALTNISVYFYYAFHLWLGFAAAALVQYGMSMLFPAKYTVPYGAIFLVAVYGLLEYIFETFTTTHLYTECYFALTFAYAAIFMLTQRGFHVSYWASIVTMVL